MLDKETVEYILYYYRRFLNEEEQDAMTHQSVLFKLQHYASIAKTTIDNLPEMFRKDNINQLSTDPAVLALLENGFEHFKSKTAERVLRDHNDEVYFNNCPKCNKLARTIYAQQCRYCGYAWHATAAAQFSIITCFEVVDKPFYILGNIEDGEIKPGMKADLTWITMTIKPEITAVESIMYQGDSDPRLCTALEIKTIKEADKKFLQTFTGRRVINILK